MAHQSGMSLWPSLPPTHLAKLLLIFPKEEGIKAYVPFIENAVVQIQTGNCIGSKVRRATFLAVLTLSFDEKFSYNRAILGLTAAHQRSLRRVSVPYWRVSVAYWRVSVAYWRVRVLCSCISACSAKHESVLIGVTLGVFTCVPALYWPNKNHRFTILMNSCLC